jgi:hypothetical protein
MSASYRFSNVKAKGKSLAFTVKDAISYKHALQKAVNYIIKRFDLSDDEWETQFTFLKQNIENGYTDVSVERKREQGELDLSFNNTFNELYSGLINEDESRRK